MIWQTVAFQYIFSNLYSIPMRHKLPGEFPAQRPVTRSFDVFFDLCLNKRLSTQSWGWWFETLSRPFWRHCNVPTLTTSAWHSMPSGWQSLGQRKRNSSQFPVTVMVFSILPKQMDRTNQDIVGEYYVYNDAGEFVHTDKMKARVEHYARQLNVKFEWPSNELPGVPPTAGPSQCVCDPDMQSTQRNRIQQASWASWHRSWDAESWCEAEVDC